MRLENTSNESTLKFHPTLVQSGDWAANEISSTAMLADKAALQQLTKLAIASNAEAQFNLG